MSEGLSLAQGRTGHAPWNTARPLTGRRLGVDSKSITAPVGLRPLPSSMSCVRASSRASLSFFSSSDRGSRSRKRRRNGASLLIAAASRLSGRTLGRRLHGRARERARDRLRLRALAALFRLRLLDLGLVLVREDRGLVL